MKSEMKQIPRRYLESTKMKEEGFLLNSRNQKSLSRFKGGFESSAIFFHFAKTKTLEKTK
jgi:hypothetical protein